LTLSVVEPSCLNNVNRYKLWSSHRQAGRTCHRASEWMMQCILSLTSSLSHLGPHKRGHSFPLLPVRAGAPSVVTPLSFKSHLHPLVRLHLTASNMSFPVVVPLRLVGSRQLARGPCFGHPAIEPQRVCVPVEALTCPTWPRNALIDADWGSPGCLA